MIDWRFIVLDFFYICWATQAAFENIHIKESRLWRLLDRLKWLAVNEENKSKKAYIVWTNKATHKFSLYSQAKIEIRRIRQVYECFFRNEDLSVSISVLEANVSIWKVFQVVYHCKWKNCIIKMRRSNCSRIVKRNLFEYFNKVIMRQ